jgi:hypothetical protein
MENTENANVAPPAGGRGEMSLAIVERDRWYFVVDCKICNRSAVISEAPSPEDVPNAGMVAFSWKCPHCGKRRTYRPSEIERHQGIYI